MDEAAGIYGLEPAPRVDVRLRAQDGVPAEALDRARRMLTRVVECVDPPVWSVRARIGRPGEGAGEERLAVAQANAEVGGLPVRVQVASPSVADATERLALRLRERIELVGRRRVDQWGPSGRGGRGVLVSAPRKADREETRGPGELGVPVARPRIVRRKTCPLAVVSVDEAAWAMRLLDRDFQLFTEIGTRQDSVLYRGGPTGYRLAQVTSPSAHRLRPHSLPLTVSARPAALISAAAAVDRLARSGLPFLFFLDTGSGRSRVLYRRYDGHFGLLGPAH